MSDPANFEFKPASGGEAMITLFNAIYQRWEEVRAEDLSQNIELQLLMIEQIMNREGYPIQLRDGRNAILYSATNPLVREAVEAYRRMNVLQIVSLVLEVHAEGRKMHLLTLGHAMIGATIQHLIESFEQIDLLKVLIHVVVYNGTAHHTHDAAGELLLEAAKRGTNPDIRALIEL